ncbi:MAG: hypothetical protein PWQ57_467 [Desulfovibrionales bacterium]|nr:hypothetical protein [Desulfovibrionales bacterium]
MRWLGRGAPSLSYDVVVMAALVYLVVFVAVKINVHFVEFFGLIDEVAYNQCHRGDGAQADKDVQQEGIVHVSNSRSGLKQLKRVVFTFRLAFIYKCL